jgi:hypothetical protein
MSTAVPSTAPETSAVAAPRARGRTTVTPRALDRATAAVAAEFFGVAARSIRVELSDRDGLLALHVRTPIRTIPLSRVRERPTLIGAGDTLRERAAEGQRVIRDRVTALTGSSVAHVTVELTEIEIAERRRVE